jgi:hypothetical protein
VLVAVYPDYGTVTSSVYPVSSSGYPNGTLTGTVWAYNETISNIPYGTLVSTLLSELTPAADSTEQMTYNGVIISSLPASTLSSLVTNGSKLVVTDTNNNTVVTYKLSVNSSSDDTTTSATYVVASQIGTDPTTGDDTGTITTGAPSGTIPKAIFLQAVDQAANQDSSMPQTWDTTGLHDPVLWGDTLTIKSEDGTATEIYTIN